MITDRRIDEIEDRVRSLTTIPYDVGELISELRICRESIAEAVNAAEIRGQDTGHALAVGTVKAWITKHKLSGSAVDELIAGWE